MVIFAGDDSDFNSDEDVTAYSFTRPTPRESTSQGTERERQIVSPDANSTFMQPVTGENWQERLKALEQNAIAKPQQQFDAAKLGISLAKGMENVLKSHETRKKRSRSPDGVPDGPVIEEIDVKGQDDKHSIFFWPLRRAYKNPNSPPRD